MTLLSLSLFDILFLLGYPIFVCIVFAKITKKNNKWGWKAWKQ